jgi:hypothetical protein
MGPPEDRWTGAGEAASDHPVDALERPGHAIEVDQGEKTGEELAIEEAIKERGCPQQPAAASWSMAVS